MVLKKAGSVCNIKTWGNAESKYWPKHYSYYVDIHFHFPFWQSTRAGSCEMGGGGGSVSQRWLAQLAQSRGIKQSVTQPVTIALITPSFNTPWKECKGKTASWYLCRGFVKSKSECLGFHELSKLHISRSYVKLTIIINIVVVFSLQIRRANSSSQIGFEFPVAVLVSVG